MSDKEKQDLLEVIKELPDRQKGYITGYAAAMVELAGEPKEPEKKKKQG